jgi:hypothetical protein
VHPLRLDDAEQRDIARILGLDHLPPEVSEAIISAIVCYKATAAGATDTTIRTGDCRFESCRRAKFTTR